MSVQHHLLSHSPESFCVVSLFREGRRDTVTAVISEMPDNPGMPVRRIFASAAMQARRAYFRDIEGGRIVWVYRKPTYGGSAEEIFEVRMDGQDGGHEEWRPLTPGKLGELVNRGGGFTRRVFFPEPNALSGMAGRRRQGKEASRYGPD